VCGIEEKKRITKRHICESGIFLSPSQSYAAVEGSNDHVALFIFPPTVEFFIATGLGGLTSLYCPVSIVLVMDKPALKDVATYRDSKGMVEHLQTTLGSSNVFMSNVAGSAGWGFLISSALTYHRYRHLLSSGTIEKIVSTAKAAAAKENVAAGRHMSDFGPGKKFDQKAYERLTLKKKLSNTWFGSFMVIFPGGHYINHRNELRRKQAVNQAKVEELKKIGVVEATKENIEGGKGKCADGGDLLNEYRFVPEWDGKTEDVKRKSLWEK